MSNSRTIFVVVDNESWLIPYAKKLVSEINKHNGKAVFCKELKDISPGYIAFFLGCINIVPDNILKLNKYNLVVHESDLPNGRGFSPLTWSVLEGKNSVDICLLDAGKEVDSGDVYLHQEITLNGYELIDELRSLQGERTIFMCLYFVENSTSIIKFKQEGEPTWYPRRGPKDSELDIKKTIAEQFNLLRVVDNDKYPAFFMLDDQKYVLKIEKVIS